MKIVSIISGGLDSVTMLYLLAKEKHSVHSLSFDYGQRHKKELDYARTASYDTGGLWDKVDLSTLTKLIGGSALTDDIEVPDGHYAEDSMKITVVPNRNAIMLAIAYGVAVAEQADAVAIAVHAGDHFIYPDCRPGFINAFERMENEAVEGFGKIELLAPFINSSKSDIVKRGAVINTPFNKTWSCYKGGEIHCGTCGTCVERKEAFELAGVKDPTEYLK